MLRPEDLVAAVFDTHAWVWMASGSSKANPLRAFSGTAYISAISLWEVAMLATKGRLALMPDTESWMLENLAPPATLASLTPAVALESCALEDFHGDPADRIIVATATTMGIPLITADEKIIAWNDKHGKIGILAL